jgi:hypothetical protein
MQYLSELKNAAEQLHALCRASEIPPFDCVQYDTVTSIASFVWDGSDFALFILLEDYDLSEMTPASLRELWDEEEQAGEAVASLAVEALLN